MLTSVELDAELQLFAVEIEHEAREGVLAAKLQAIQPPSTELLPEFPLGIGGLASEAAGDWNEGAHHRRNLTLAA